MKDFGLRLQTFAFDELVSESSFSLQGLDCREQKLATIFKLPLPLPHILQQHWVWLVSLDRAQTIGHSRLDLFATQNLSMVWAWTLLLSDALGARALFWFGHGWSGYRMLWEGWSMDALVIGHECSGYRMLWEHERYHGLSMDALVIVCCGNMNEIMVWA